MQQPGTDAFDFSEEEIAGFAAGSAGTPVRWSIYQYLPKVHSVEDALANQPVTIVDQCRIESRYYGIEIWAIIEGPYGRYLMQVQHTASSDRGYVGVYTPEYIAINANGVASEFDNFYYELDEVHDLDEAWAIIKSHAVE